MKSITSLSGGIVAIIFSLGAATTPLSAQTYSATILADHPSNYWRLQETSGTTAADSAGTAPGTYTNALIDQTGYTSTAQPSELAAAFGSPAGQSSNSCVGGMAVDFATNANGEFTVEAWVNGASQSASAGIVGKGTGGNEQFFLDCGAPNNDFRFFLRNAAGTSITLNSALSPDGNWHYLVGVCDQVHSSAYLYIDGFLVASNACTGGIKASNEPYMSIGSRQSGTNNYDYQFNGSIAEVAVYRTALTAAKVLTHYYAAGIVPIITQQPPSVETVDANTPLTVVAAAVGTPPLTYQWLTNGTPMAGQTNATFSIASVPAALNFLQLLVTNADGSTYSQGMSLNVNSGTPQFVTNVQPATLSLYAGQPFTYYISMQGTEPFYYQWQLNGTNIFGATGSSYTIYTPLGTNTISVNVSNSVGVAPASSQSVLTSVPIPGYPYPSSVIASGPVAYWRLDEPEMGGGDGGATAYDFMGDHNGTYNEVLLGVPGYSPDDPDTACAFGTSAGFGVGSDMVENNNSSGGVPNINSYLQGQKVVFSVECWVKGAPGQNPSGSCIVQMGASSSYSFGIDASGGNGVFRYYYRTTNGNVGLIPSTFVPDNNWHQLVAVMDEVTAGATVFYVDCNLAGTLALPGVTNSLYNTGAPLSIGSDGTYQFNGTIDEVSFYTNALSISQILAHYNAAPLPPAFEVVPPSSLTALVGGNVVLSTTVIGSRPLTNQWFMNNVAMAGQTNVYLNLTNLSVGTNTFTLYVTNAYGFTNTLGTTVQVAAGNGPPVLVSDITPLTNILYAGGSITYSVAVTGSLPLYYQWYSNSVAVSGATTPFLTLNGLTTNAAGQYYCVITNSLNSVSSSTAQLGIVAAPTNAYALTVIADHPSAYWRLDETNGSTNGYDYVGGNVGVYSNTAGITHQAGVFGTNFDADTSANFNTNGAYTKQNSAASNYLGFTMTNTDFSVPNGENAEFSVEAWIRGFPNDTQTSGGGIVAKGYGNGGEEFNLDVHGGVRFYARAANGGLAASAQASGLLTGNAGGTAAWVMDGLWHHVVGVCDEANDNLLLYVDGNLIGYPVISNGVVPAAAYLLQVNHTPSTGTNGLISSSFLGGGYGLFAANNNNPTNGNAGKYGDNSISIGARNSGTNNVGFTLGFDGAVDEVALYSYCLTPAQVSNHYAVGVNAPVTIYAQKVGAQTQLTWAAVWATSTLQVATNASGPWSTVPGGGQGYVVPANPPTPLFYRVKNQ